MANTTSVLFVGYSCQAKDDLDGLVSDWPKINEGDSEEAKAAAKSKRGEIALSLGLEPFVHLFQLNRVIIVDPQTQQTFDSLTLAPKTAALTVSGWLMDHYPDAWGKTLFDQPPGPPKVSFYGFDMRMFLKMLGFGAAELGFVLPPGLWYANSDHRDMEGALLPTSCYAKKFTMWQAMKSLGMLTGSLQSLSSDWKPGHVAELDVRIAIEVANRLGLIPRAPQTKVSKSKAKPAAAPSAK